MKDSETDTQRPKILYLEDEVLIAFDIAAFLEDLDVGDVTSVQKLTDAWSAVEDQTFQLAVLDINVDRHQTSFELGKHLQDAGCTVIYASGNSAEAARLRGRGYQFVDKPFGDADLEPLIRAALNTA